MTQTNRTNRLATLRGSTAFKACMGLAALLTASQGNAATLVSEANRPLTFGVFAALFLITLGITFWAARKNSSVKDFYTAGGALSGRINGLAIAGDYLSAAAFLGVSGLIAIYGLDGITYVIGFFVSFIPVLLLIAEPCRNLGKYTLGDVLAFRNNFRASKFAVAISSVLVALFYMVPQIVGGAVIIAALIGIPFEISVVSVGVLMLVYVLFGGMRATTSVQILKATLLIAFCFLLVVLSWAPYGFNISAFFSDLVGSSAVQKHVLGTLLNGVSQLSAEQAGQRFMEPGLYLKNPLEQISLSLALVLGTAAMPHILMRFFTVRDAQSARTSALTAMLLIGLCHLFIIVIGFSAALHLGPFAITTMDKGGNLAAPMLAQFLGGGADSLLGNLMLAFVAAVSFATIVAVVAGLTLAAASTLAHDVYVGAVRQGKATEGEQATAARLATLAIAVIAICVGISAKGQNVAQLVGLGYAVAASANLPALLLTLYWRRCSTAGVIAGLLGGTVLSIGLVLVSPNMSYPLQQKQVALAAAAKSQAKIELIDKGALVATATEREQLLSDVTKQQATASLIPDSATSLIGLREPWVQLRNPGLISIPLGFALVILFSLLFPSQLSLSRWVEFSVRRETGLGVAQAAQH
ncbi:MULTISPECIES: solute symporter family protein [Pseudomonas]|uniref:Putative symporter, permease component n=1 Tax=Pseudomonas brassicacearum (strain NFM421) TaxID=994484 RepID=F2K7Y3_PSEBN|nr:MULTISPECIES: cation acetate symporter [Pseudomonas]AEA69804.1 putative symporter, permease component [Pseudomonas brassicacearum subsp. brassicacearum NFM421]KIR16852.1 Cation/acetate symporter ActP [Pseudomonas fluorescens]WLG66027.1 cation acetate symporter [Pseudomonas brassicacearum]BBP54145.1 cation acetate symporter [Pseudomonas sp. St386]